MLSDNAELAPRIVRFHELRASHYAEALALHPSVQLLRLQGLMPTAIAENTHRIGWH